MRLLKAYQLLAQQYPPAAVVALIAIAALSFGVLAVAYHNTRQGKRKRMKRDDSDQDTGDTTVSDNTDQVTLGEVYRLCQRIEKKVDTTNGRVTKLENDALRLKTLWTAAVVVFGFFADWLRHKLGLS